LLLFFTGLASPDPGEAGHQAGFAPMESRNDYISSEKATLWPACVMSCFDLFVSRIPGKYRIRYQLNRSRNVYIVLGQFGPCDGVEQSSTASIRQQEQPK